MLSRSPLRALPLLLAGVLSVDLAAQQLSVAFPVRDRAVLQRDVPHPLSGTAPSGVEVVVDFAGQQKTCTADDTGRWVVTLDPLTASYEEEDIHVHFARNGAVERIRVKDVLVGETWLCGGQSNMQFGAKTDADWSLEVLSLDQPSVRVMQLRRPSGKEPEPRGQWRIATREEVPHRLTDNDTAIGYHFAARLQRILDVPVGVICNAVGGTIVETWIDRERLAEFPACEELLGHWDRQAAEFEKKNPDARPRQGPRGHRNHPGTLYEELVEPLRGVPIRGALYYQGESNGLQGWRRYAVTFPELIRHWRERLGNPQLPVGVISLAGFGTPQRVTNPTLEMIPTNFYLAPVREVHRRTALEMAGVGLISTFDLGDAIDIHPSRKRQVADRSARWALAAVYDVPVPHRAPRVVGQRVLDGRMRLNFDSDPVVDPNARGNKVPITRDGPYEGFVIAGADQIWHRAQVRALPNERELEIWSPEVEQPVAVRYAWAGNPNGNALGADRLPVAPFRTDEWPIYEERPLDKEAEKQWEARRREALRRATGG